MKLRVRAAAAILAAAVAVGPMTFGAISRADAAVHPGVNATLIIPDSHNRCVIGDFRLVVHCRPRKGSRTFSYRAKPGTHLERAYNAIWEVRDEHPTHQRSVYVPGLGVIIESEWQYLPFPI